MLPPGVGVGHLDEQGQVATVTEAATRMHDHNVSRLPVVDADGRLVGIIARGDILRTLVRRA